MKEKLFKWLSEKAEDKSWVGNRADPTSAHSMSWKISHMEVKFLVIWEVELKVWFHGHWHRVSYGKDGWIGKLAVWFYNQLEAVKNLPPQDDDFYDGWCFQRGDVFDRAREGDFIPADLDMDGEELK